MDDQDTTARAPAGWLEILAESEAELEAGQTVPAEVVRQMLRDSIARIKAGQDAELPRNATRRR
jgi:hypothetical protein